MKLTQTIIVSRLPEKVFAFRCDLANTPTWQRGVVSAILETPGPVGLGSRCAEVRNGPQSSLDDWNIEITECDPSHVLCLTAQCAEAQWEERHEFVMDGTKDTRYTLAIEVTHSTVPAAKIQKQIVETLLQLKWAMEGPIQLTR